MRNINQWGMNLRKVLRENDDLISYVQVNLPEANEFIQSQEVERLAKVITEVELGLTLLREVAPQQPAISVHALLIGHRFPVSELNSDQKWLLVQKARFYLVRRKGKQWERSLAEYVSIPKSIRIFDFQDSIDVPKLIPSTTLPQRIQVYQKTLSQTPPLQKRDVELATKGYWFAKISYKGNTAVEVPIKISEAVANIACKPTVSFQSRRTAKNPPHTVNFDDLLLDAQEMDEKLRISGYEPENYYERLSGIALKLYDVSSNDYQPGKKLHIDQLVHIVGLLNVGKTTVLEVLTYHFASRKERCALVVSDVASTVRLASLFREALGIAAAPILGTQRAQQLEKVYEPILATTGEDIEKGALHPAWRWFSPVCPLLAMVQSEEKWEFGDEPCHNLYQKNLKKQKNYEDDEDDDESEKSTCPFYYKCPRHQLERDIAEAIVWILTPASLVHTRVPKQVLTEKLTFAEAIYRECKYLFIDEADRVQVQLDEAFAPDEVLLDNSNNSFLNKLGINISPIYNSNRVSMTAYWFESWTNAQYDAQKTINRMCPYLYKQSRLVEWLGNEPFTGRSLFARIIHDIEFGNAQASQQSPPKPKKSKLTRRQTIQLRQQNMLAGLVPSKQRQRRQELMETFEGFLQAPLSRSRGGKLSEIALGILSGETDPVIGAEVAEWWKNFLEIHSLQIPINEQFEDLIRNTIFAILVTILDNRLIFLVDNFSTIRSFIDLHDTSQTLVHRPPRDYLPVIPAAPMGNILGFKYTRDRANKQGGKLEYFRYVGIGRYLLLNFPTLFAADEWDGPHTVIISGTSYAPGSPAYHIRRKPDILLEPDKNNHTAGDAGIAQSEFFYSPQKRMDGEHIAVSGLLPRARENAVEEMVKAIYNQYAHATSFLDDLFETLEEKEKHDPKIWGDRGRILIITNSYGEAALVETILKPLYKHVNNIDEIAVLRRDNAPANLAGIPRSKIRNLKDLPHKIVVAPLMALERGHNILNDKRIAAFGAVLFLCRPMPVPDDWQTTVQQINDWALNNVSESSFYQPLLSKGETLTLNTAQEKFYAQSLVKMIELNCRARYFQHLFDDELTVLCWTQLVSIWQVIGRLVRGGVPCIVHFLDKKFAPQSAAHQVDTQKTSLLVGILKELEKAVDPKDKEPWELTLAISLYGAFLNALQQTRKLKL
jgi:pPIWI RE three-gene island domain Z